MITQKQIVVDGYMVPYTLHIKKVKNLILKIEPSGEIVVSANAYVPQHKIDAFIKERVSWILKKQQQQVRQYNALFEDCMQQDYIYFFGQRLDLICVQSNQAKVIIQDAQMFVYYKNEKIDCNKTILNFIRKTCEDEFTKIVVKYLDKLRDYQLPMPKIKYRKMKTRWGSCATRSSLITLNTNMFHYPIAFIEYVVLHELVHFIQPNHSKHFYQIVEYYMPDYKERIKLSQKF